MAQASGSFIDGVVSFTQLMASLILADPVNIQGKMRFILLLAACQLLLICFVSSSQVPFSASYPSETTAFSNHKRIELPYEDEVSQIASSRPSVEHIIAGENGKHVILTHRDFPEISVRIKKVAGKTRSVDAMMLANAVSDPKYNHSDPTAFCDPTTTSWSGYVDTIDGKSFFFYFFESRSNPSKDPVLMWLTGGPGCSSSLGLFMELGPCLVPERQGKVSNGPPINGTVWNPFSWNNEASIIFLDQPVDVGFSYSRYGVHTYDSDKASKDVYAFLRIFFSSFNKFDENDFVITGESYAGRYIPRFASQIIDQNMIRREKAARAGKKPKKTEIIKLKKVAIGNGLTDIAVQTPSYYDFTCTRKSGVEPVLSISECKRLRAWKDRCLDWLKRVCRDTYNAEDCKLAEDSCSQEFNSAYFNTGRNPYNVKDLCLAGYEPNLCYSLTEDIRNFLDRDDVRELIGAESIASIGKFKSCNNDVARGFNKHDDENVQNVDYVAGLLERGLQILIYVGKLDWICNHLGNRAWVEQMEWTDQEAFHEAKQYAWIVDGQEAGMTQRGGGLTWATVEGAGHMVPYDKPKVALEMLTRFLNEENL